MQLGDAGIGPQKAIEIYREQEAEFIDRQRFSVSVKFTNGTYLSVDTFKLWSAAREALPQVFGPIPPVDPLPLRGFENFGPATIQPNLDKPARDFLDTWKKNAGEQPNVPMGAWYNVL